MVKKDFSLKDYNTFGIDVHAKEFAVFSNLDELSSLVETENNLLILGGGSNLLFTKDFDGRVLKNDSSGLEIIGQDDEYAYIKAGAGESWHTFVMFCVDQNLSGVENLALIPGNVGASPMQNIGAYGVEIKEVIAEVEAYHLRDKTVVKFTAEDCAFGYRESVFKNKFRGQFVILSVTYRLSKSPRFNISYGAIKNELENMHVTELSISCIARAVINIRKSKLPDPKVIGNAGSFYKNPEIQPQEFNNLKQIFPGIIGHTLPDNNIKLAAGWLIEQCGWKGKRVGNTGCHKDQALVIVNYGGATGAEVFDFSERILQDVRLKFGILLEREVNIY